jgi:23S rRNA (guanosine2251-2'-O)-methyltransferase
MATLGDMGYVRVALDGDATTDLDAGLANLAGQPVALVLGAEGPGLRELTTKLCDLAVHIPAAGGFGSLNVSNAAAIALYAARRGPGPPITFS